MTQENSNSCLIFSSREIKIGKLKLGGNNPILIQSMTNTPTMDTEATVNQTIRIFDAGADMVRITARSIAEAKNLKQIKKSLLEKNYDKPIVADIHFDPLIAIEAAKHVDKIRINPGNYVNLFPNNISYTNEEYQTELNEIAKIIKPLISTCIQHKTAIRIGINHGSLSKRVISRYGDTPQGMVESAIEFMRLFSAENFQNLVISMKASDVRTMIWSNRLLVKRMNEEKFDFPLHLGVTEAGEGEDGRIKSAIGIGSLLIDNIGDTIRVSLTEKPENEIPVAKEIIDVIQKIKANKEIAKDYFNSTKPFSFSLNRFEQESNILPKVICDDTIPTTSPLSIDKIRQEILNHCDNKLSFTFNSQTQNFSDFSIIAGSVFADGYGNEILINKSDFKKYSNKIFSLLQSCKRLISKAEFISCPSCGRTAYDIQKAISDVKKNFSHLKGISIAVMGCIVNGPGEMSGAIYGCVGSKPKHVHIYYKGKVEIKDVPEENIVSELKKLMREKGDYFDAK